MAGLTQNEFVLLVQNMLGRLHDQHVVLTSGNTTLRTYTPDYFVNWDNSVWQQYLARGGAQVRNGAVSAVFDGVPYIAIQSWNPTRSRRLPRIFKAAGIRYSTTRSRGLLSPSHLSAEQLTFAPLRLTHLAWRHQLPGGGGGAGMLTTAGGLLRGPSVPRLVGL